MKKYNIEEYLKLSREELDGAIWDGDALEIFYMLEQLQSELAQKTKNAFCRGYAYGQRDGGEHQYNESIMSERDIASSSLMSEGLYDIIEEAQKGG